MRRSAPRRRHPHHEHHRTPVRPSTALLSRLLTLLEDRHDHLRRVGGPLTVRATARQRRTLARRTAAIARRASTYTPTKES